jgi:surface protein
LQIVKEFCTNNDKSLPLRRENTTKLSLYKPMGQRDITAATPMNRHLLTLLFSLLFSAAASLDLTAQEIYAVLNSSQTTLTLYYDSYRSSRNGVTDWSTYNNAAGKYNSLTTIELDPSMKNARPTSTAEWFSWFALVTEIQNLEYLNTSEVTDMKSMFFTVKATDLNVSGFDTRNVTDMSLMFYSCIYITSLDLSGFNTEINNCTSLAGGNGTPYDSNTIDLTYARPDGMGGSAGYFTYNSTDIDEITATDSAAAARKILQDGRLYIITPDGKTCDLTGGRVK